MRSVVTVDEFMELKEKSLRVFIFVLADKVQSLEYDNHWIYHLNAETHVVRCTEDDFKMLDIGVYPKLMITQRGKELALFNGIPEMEILQRELKRFL